MREATLWIPRDSARVSSWTGGISAWTGGIHAWTGGIGASSRYRPPMPSA
jgi:hypothetical protein